MKSLFFIFILLSCSHSKVKVQQYNTIFKPLENKAFFKIFEGYKTVQQIVTYKRLDDSKQMHIVFSMRDALFVSVLSLQGVELLTLKINDQNIEKLSGLPMMKKDFFIKVMEDILAVYGPKKLVYGNILSDIKVEETPFSRVFKGSDGKPFISISYSGQDKLKSVVKLENLVMEYNLKIETIEISHETLHK